MLMYRRGSNPFLRISITIRWRSGASEIDRGYA